ncbi:solute carrier family 23 protein [Cupriavidus basilensis]
MSMCVVMLITLVESTGMFLALADITGKRLSNEDLTRGLRADGLGTVIGGVFNTFPYTSFSQNVGLVTVTGVRSRYVAVGRRHHPDRAGPVPEDGALVEASVPQFVLGGAGIVMFGMVAATGVAHPRLLSISGRNRFNLFIVAISIGFGMIPDAGADLLRSTCPSGPTRSPIAASCWGPSWRWCSTSSSTASSRAKRRCCNAAANTARGTE